MDFVPYFLLIIKKLIDLLPQLCSQGCYKSQNGALNFELFELYLIILFGLALA